MGYYQSKFPGSTPQDARVIEWYQQKFKNADMFCGEGAAVRSRMCGGGVRRHGIPSYRAVDQSRNKFMYSKLNVFESMEDVNCALPVRHRDGTWHSIHGLGNAIFPYVEVFNRLRCKEVDGAMIAASVLLQSADSTKMQAQQLVKIGNLSILPPGLTVASTNIGQGIEATTGVRRDMEGTG